MADRFPLILNTSANQIQEIASGDNLDLTGTGINNAGIITAGNVTVGAATTDLIVNGDARVTGILTVGTGSLTLNGPSNLVNVGTALTLGHTQGLQFHTQNLHSAGFEVNQINVSGVATATTFKGNGDFVELDVDGHTNLDNVSIAGVSTVTGNIDVVTAGTDVGLTVTQNGTGNILNLYDGSNLRFYVNQYGNPTVTSGNPVIASINSSSSVTTTLFSNSSGQGVLQTNSGHSLTLGTGGVEKLRITSNGHVNIGGDYAQTTYKLKVTGTSYFNGALTASGNVTAVDGTFSGNVSIGGTLTYEDVTNIDSVGIVTARAGVHCSTDGVANGVKIGAGQDLILQHNGTNSFIDNNTGDLNIQTTGSGDDILIQSADDFTVKVAGSETAIQATGDGAVELYHNNTKRFETTSNGVSIPQILQMGTSGSYIDLPDNASVYFGNGDDLRIYHSGAASIIANNGTGDLYLQDDGNVIIGKVTNAEVGIKVIGDGAVELYHNNVKKFETASHGVEVTGKLTFATEGLAGGSIDLGIDADLNLYHDNSNAYIDNNTGHFYIRNDGNSTSEKLILQAKGGEQSLTASPNGAVELYYDNTKRLETTSSGAKITGDLTLNHSSDSTEVTGYAVQRIWGPTIAAGNVYKCGQWYEGEGAIQLYISVRSVQGGHSGSATYLFQGGYASIAGQNTKRLLPLASGRGHGDGADTGMNSNAWEVLIDNINDYTYAVYIHVPSGRATKVMQVAVTEMNRGNTFTDFSSSVAYSSISSSVTSGDLTSLQTSHAEVVRQHSLPAFRVGRNTDQSVGSGDAIQFNVTSGSSLYFNQGGYYSSGTGRFTAPYAGVYHFYALVIFENVPDNTDMTDSWDFYLNNSQLAFSARRSKYRSDYTGTSGYYTDPATITIYMQKDDYIWCRNKYAGKTIHNNPTYSYFCGHFCG